MSNHDRIIISWLELRRLIGFIGIVHPVLLYLGGVIIFSTGLQSSMSAYYYTGMRGVFVGLGFVIGFFLLSYKGYDKQDRIVSAVAGGASIVVALFPAAPDFAPTDQQKLIGIVHVISAFIFLLALSYFCLMLFPKSGDATPTPAKLKRNRIYRVTGIIIILCLAFVGFYFIPTPFQALIKPYHPVYFAELISFWAFGAAWVVKGEAILGDG